MYYDVLRDKLTDDSSRIRFMREIRSGLFDCIRNEKLTIGDDNSLSTNIVAHGIRGTDWH